MMKVLLRDQVWLWPLVAVVLLLVVFAASFSLNSLTDISYVVSPFAGDTVIVRFPAWVSEEAAKRSFHIEPKVEGDLAWIADFHELHFVPTLGFPTDLEFRAFVTLPSPWLAAVVPQAKSLKFTAAVSSHVSSNVGKEAFPEPAVSRGKLIDINLSTMVMTLFEDGMAVKTYPVGAKGNPWKTPTRQGTFRVRSKEPRHWSTIYKLWMPWSMNFFGDYFIHAWPSWPNGKRVNSVYSGGCVRMHDEDAKALYDWAEVGTAVVVHSTPGALSIVTPESIEDGDLVREVSDYRVYIAKHAAEKRFKRHVLTRKFGEWYPHLEPFDRRIQIVPDGTLAPYTASRWIRLAGPDSLGKWEVYEVDDAGTKHRMFCRDLRDCSSVWQPYGWDADEIYTVTEKELAYYRTGQDIALVPTPEILASRAPE